MEAGDAPTVARDAEISVVPAQHRRQPFALGRQRRVPTELHLTAQLLEFADHPRALGLPHDHEPPFPGCSAVMTATPLGWRNAVTEPVFFADIDPADTAKVLAAIREHAPTEAVVFAWWDMSCRIRALAGRQAPLDDPLARGLLTPSAWTVNVAAINENQRAYWGAGVPSGEGEAFAKFIDARCSWTKRAAWRRWSKSLAARRFLSPCISPMRGRRRRLDPIFFRSLIGIFRAAATRMA